MVFCGKYFRLGTILNGKRLQKSLPIFSVVTFQIMIVIQCVGELHFALQLPNVCRGKLIGHFPAIFNSFYPLTRKSRYEPAFYTWDA